MMAEVLCATKAIHWSLLMAPQKPAVFPEAVYPNDVPEYPLILQLVQAKSQSSAGISPDSQGTFWE